MRIALLLVVALAVAGCGKKKSPQNPGAADSAQMREGAEEKDANAPAGEEPKDPKSDPQEGGE